MRCPAINKQLLSTCQAQSMQIEKTEDLFAIGGDASPPAHVPIDSPTFSDASQSDSRTTSHEASALMPDENDSHGINMVETSSVAVSGDSDGAGGSPEEAAGIGEAPNLDVPLHSKGMPGHMSHDSSEGTKHLGRPAKHMEQEQNVSLPDFKTDAENMENSISRPGIDDRPIERAGSRGGAGKQEKAKGLASAPKQTSRRKQSTLNFRSNSRRLSLSLKQEPAFNSSNPNGSSTFTSNVPKDEEENRTQSTSSHAPNQANPSCNQFIIKITLSKNGTGDNTGVTVEKIFIASPKQVKTQSSSSHSKMVTLKLKSPISRTSIVRDKSKNTRSNPGPLLPLTYDLYDENLFRNRANSSVASKPLAMGFPVKHEPYSCDIVYIIAFLNKFSAIVQVGLLGPADFETGLGLEHKTHEGSEASNSPSHFEVSTKMSILFRRLLALALNRKKPITIDGQKPAIQELKTKYYSLGLPDEWKIDNDVSSDHPGTKYLADDLEDTDLIISNTKTSESIQDSPNDASPFSNRDFEIYGLSGIKSSLDRLIMLRMLVMWSLSNSIAIKSYLMNIVNNQEPTSERDTLFASRAILKGLNQTCELKREIDIKRNKRNKQKEASPSGETLRNYHDPTSDPFSHPLSFRFNEFVIGDCGFHIGRFYLVRMSDESSQTVSSIAQMRKLANEKGRNRFRNSSSFKLYVEDVHAMLSRALQDFGVEFDTDGNEVPQSTSTISRNYWYVVAENSEQLEAFLMYLAKILGVKESSENMISPSCIAYKPILHMYQYLQLVLPVFSEIEKQKEVTEIESRSSRRKKVNYNVEDPFNEDAIEDYEYQMADDDYADLGEEEDVDEEYID